MDSIHAWMSVHPSGAAPTFETARQPEIFARPRHAYTRALLGSIPRAAMRSR